MDEFSMIALQIFIFSCFFVKTEDSDSDSAASPCLIKICSWKLRKFYLIWTF